MALRINLYHEVLRTRKQEQYDPLKLSILGMIIIIIGLVSWYVVELNKRSSASSAFQAKQSEYNRLKPLEDKARTDETEFANRLGIMDKLHLRVEQRFYWAPVLQDLASSVPPSIQTTKVSGDVTGDRLHKCQLSIEGIAAGDEPRAVAEEFRRSLTDRFGKHYKKVNAAFKSLEDGTDSVTLDGASLHTALFSVNLTFSSGEEPPPPPPVAPRRKGSAKPTVAQQNP